MKPGRHQVDDLIITAIAGGATYAEAGKQANVTERTVANRMADPGFRQRVAEVRSRLLEQTAAGLTASGLRAVGALDRLLDAESESVQLGAAKALIELGAKVREGHDLEQRITALEQALKRSDTHG